MYAELALDNKILKDVIEKTLEPEVKKELTDEIVKEYNVNISRACKLMDIHRSYFYYTEKKDDSEVEQAIREAAEFGTASGRSSRDFVVTASPGTTRRCIEYINRCITRSAAS